MLDEIEHLKEFEEVSLKDFIESWRDVRTVERSIQIIAQAVLDVAGHIVANKGWITPASYRELVMALAQNLIFERELANRLADLIGMRNILVHDYMEVDAEIVHGSIVQIISDGPAFVTQILSSLENDE